MRVTCGGGIGVYHHKRNAARAIATPDAERICQRTRSLARLRRIACAAPFAGTGKAAAPKGVLLGWVTSSSAAAGIEAARLVYAIDLPLPPFRILTSAMKR
jgi:hypothetical protein